MKTEQEIIETAPKFLGMFSDSSEDEIFANFNVPEEKRPEWKILFGAYDGYYSCGAFLLVTDGKKVFEVNGSHCSCYGLEDQFEPEEVSLVELGKRLNADGSWDYYLEDYKQELKDFIGV